MSRFEPHSVKNFRLSRSKIEDFLNCARCFYLDRRRGLRKPSQAPFKLNNAVDHLLKKEFDHYRNSGLAHPIMKQAGLQAIPYQNSQLEEWREPLRGGLRAIDAKTGFEVSGAPDDLWVNIDNELIVVDYKATSQEDAPNLNSEWKKAYKRQVEVYQWLLQKNGFKVSKTAYFVYANALTKADALNHQLAFSLTLLEHQGDTTWIEAILEEILQTLEADEAPPASSDCEWCLYRKNAQNLSTAPIQKSLL